MNVQQEYGSWDFNESTNFVKVKSTVDKLDYLIYDTKGESPIQEKTLNGKKPLDLLAAITPNTLKLELANILAQVRRDINKTLIYAYLHPEMWRNHKIAWGIYHTLDIHIPCWAISMPKFASIPNKDTASDLIIDECIKMGVLFNYQEMPRNNGILGLNKPKHIIGVPMIIKGKKVTYEMCDCRAIFLTIRDYQKNKKREYSKILDLALHELTHTTCNDCRWKPDNHLPPYNQYRAIINKFAKGAGLKFD
jgi:hypothetical protein